MSEFETMAYGPHTVLFCLGVLEFVFGVSFCQDIHKRFAK